MSRSIIEEDQLERFLKLRKDLFAFIEMEDGICLEDVRRQVFHFL